MPLQVEIIACRTDNYAYLLSCPISQIGVLIDAPESQPVLDRIDDLYPERSQLKQIWLTHHHPDHVAGVEELRQATGASVLGASADQHRLPQLDRGLVEGDEVVAGASRAKVFDVSGHTLGHIAFYFPDDGMLFSGDSLMSLGCGRLFEGTAKQMWDSLAKLMSLPADTRIYSGHEYTTGNAEFALSLEPDNRDLRQRMDRARGLLARGLPTIPSTIADELAANPFLRCADPEFKSRQQLANLTDEEAFARIRRLKDSF